MYKNKLKQAIVGSDDSMNLTVYEGKNCSVRQIIDQAETMPFFADHRLILVENSGFFKSATPELADYLPQMPPETILVFVEDEVDKRGKLYKTVKNSGRITELARQDEKTLNKWVLGTLKREKKSIQQSTLDLFLEMTGNDMENIANELEKLICYTMGRSAIERRDVEEICTARTENRIFDMIRAVAEKRQKEALDLYYDLLAQKEPPMRILYLVARQFNQLYEIRELRAQGYDTAMIVQKTGLQSFIVRRGLAESSHFTVESLKQAVIDCVEAETQVKTGQLGDKIAVEMILVRYSSSDV
jgi:DNA polymerase-3 subunit delta